MIVIRTKILYEGEAFVEEKGYGDNKTAITLSSELMKNMKDNYINILENSNMETPISAISLLSYDIKVFGEVGTNVDNAYNNTNVGFSFILGTADDDYNAQNVKNIKYGKYILEVFTVIKFNQPFFKFTKTYIDELVEKSIIDYLGGEYGINYKILVKEEVPRGIIINNFRKTSINDKCRMAVDDFMRFDVSIHLFSASFFLKNPSALNLTKNINNKGLYEAINNSPIFQSLSKELKRVENSTLKEFHGYPVNYIIENCKDSISAAKILASYILENNRTISREISKCNELNAVDSEVLESYKGGIVIVDTLNWNIRNNNSETISVSHNNIEDIDIIKFLEIYKPYNNKILLIFIIDKDNIGKLQGFIDNSFSTVIISASNYNYNNAVKYMKYLCSVDGINYQKSLLKKGDIYTQKDLLDIYDEYRDIYLKKNIYTEYNKKEYKISRTNKVIKGKAYSDLCGMIGLKNVKDVIDQIISFCKMQKVYKDKGIKLDNPSRHMIFTGSPGTAKTTVARLFGQILKDNDILESGKIIEIGRSDLVEKYVGWTAKNVREKIMSAKGGVLFIDEAYSLVDDKRGSFGDEVINTLVEQMDNIKEDTIIIFAGYPDKMEGFMNTNPGIRSRIAFHVRFDNYSVPELIDILKSMAKGKNLNINNEALRKAEEEIIKAINTKDFGNGRFVRSLLERSIMKQSQRLLRNDTYVTMKNVDIMTIDYTDVVDMNIGKKEKPKLGFSV